MADLKLVYAAPTEETALNELELFKDKWDSKYPKIYKSAEGPNIRSSAARFAERFCDNCCIHVHSFAQQYARMMHIPFPLQPTGGLVF